MSERCSVSANVIIRMMMNESSDESNDEELLLTLMLLRRQTMMRKRPKKRAVWGREIFKARKRQGTYNLLQEMQLNDRESYFRYLLKYIIFILKCAIVYPRVCTPK